MCGINLLVEHDGASADSHWVRRGNELLAHRGPDGDSVFVKGSVALGHTRLGIVDAAGGTQPFFNEQRSVAVVCNGEIYNYKELRARLIAAGHRFRSQSDCEVIVHLYEDDPLGYVDALQGMFAFALVDWSRDQVQLVRDRLGIKPLFFYASERRLLASSECKAILAHHDVPRRISRAQVDEVLTFGYGMGSATVFEGLEVVPPATQMCWSLDGRQSSVRRYWSPSFAINERGPDDMREALRAAVESHTIGDAAVGVYLSGGLDSSCIAAALKAVQPDGTRAFAMTFADPAFDESQFARAAASHLGIELVEQHFERWSVADLVSAVYHLEQPQMVTLDVASMGLSRRVRANGMKAVLAGDGADELFGGYNHFRIDHWRRTRPTEALEPKLQACGYPRDYWAPYLEAAEKAEQVRECLGVFPPWFPTWWAKRPITDGLIAEPERDKLGIPSSVQELCRPLLEARPGWTELDRAIWFELQSRLPNWILSRSDRNSMASSVEVRVPFMDAGLVDFVGGLSDDQRLGLTCEKVLLRESHAGLLPPSLINRPKFPFNTPVAWLFGDGVPLVDALLSRASLSESGLFEPNRVAQLLRSVRGELARRDGMLQALREQTLLVVLTTQILHALFVANDGPDRSALDELTRPVARAG